MTQRHSPKHSILTAGRRNLGFSSDSSVVPLFALYSGRLAGRGLKTLSLAACSIGDVCISVSRCSRSKPPSKPPCTRHMQAGCQALMAAARDYQERMPAACLRRAAVRLVCVSVKVLTSLDLSCNSITDDSAPAVSLVAASVLHAAVVARASFEHQVLAQPKSALECLSLSMNLLSTPLSLCRHVACAQLLVMFHRLVWHLAAHGRCTPGMQHQTIPLRQHMCIHSYLQVRLQLRRQDSGWPFCLDASANLSGCSVFYNVGDFGRFSHIAYMHLKLRTLLHQQCGITSR